MWWHMTLQIFQIYRQCASHLTFGAVSVVTVSTLLTIFYALTPNTKVAPCLNEVDKENSSYNLNVLPTNESDAFYVDTTICRDIVKPIESGVCKIPLCG